MWQLSFKVLFCFFLLSNRNETKVFLLFFVSQWTIPWEPLTCVQNTASTEAWLCSFLRDPQGLQVTYPQKVKTKYFRKQLLLQEKTYINKQGEWEPERERAHCRYLSQKMPSLMAPLGFRVWNISTEILHWWPTSLRTGFFIDKMILNFPHRNLIKMEIQYI